MQPVKDRSQHVLELPRDDINDEEVLLSLPHSNHIIKIGLHPLFEIRESYPWQDLLQPQQVWLQLDVYNNMAIGSPCLIEKVIGTADVMQCNRKETIAPLCAVWPPHP
jgi:hypothetical protein